MKTKIRIFPDFCSSGLWTEKPSVNLNESRFENILSPEILIALKYWHNAWETHYDYKEGEHLYSEYFRKVWEQDGINLVAAMNKYQDQYEFIYVGDNW